MPRILHTADLHIDSRFESLPPEKAGLRRKELFGTMEKIISLTNENRVDLLLIAGDFLESDCVFYDTLEALAGLFAQTPARVFISPGNHDCIGPDSPYRSVGWPGNVHIFSSRRIARLDIPAMNTSVYGAAFDTPSCPRSLLSGFRSDGLLGVNLMVMHADVGGSAPQYNPVSEEELTASGLSYFAAGHIHKHSGILSAGKTLYAYPGCPEGRGFDETGEKGVILGDIGADGHALGFVPTAARRCHALTVDLTGNDPAAAALRALEGVPESDLVKLTLTGEAGADGLQTEAIGAALAGRFFHLVLLNRTRAGAGLWEGAETSSLRGLFLSQLRHRYANADSEQEKELLELAARYGLAALDNRNPPEAKAVSGI